MRAIDYVARTSAGVSERGSVLAQDGVTVIPASQGQEISLNLRQTDIHGYSRDGGDLVITLADGRVVVLDDYYGGTGVAQTRLFISADGYLNEVSLIEGAEGTVYAQYGPTEQWGKWSPTEDLIFLSGDDVTVPVGGDDEVSMLGAGLLAGGSLLGLGGAGAAGLAAAAVIGAGSGGGDGGGGGPTRIPPSVNEDGTITIGGDDADNPTIAITGGGEPGSDVGVTIGDKTVETVIDESGEWDVVFEGDTFPEDGEHDVVVVVTEPDDTETTLDGPSIVIDTTPPEVTVEEGTVATDHVVNAEDYEDGVDIAGQGEPGAAVKVVVDGQEQTTVIGDDGHWAVTFDPADLAGGEREAEVLITATDSFGNSTTVTDALAIDTVPHPITINGAAIGGDGVVNFAEAAAGFQVTGTSAPGATVRVTLGDVERDVIVDGAGNWSAQFDASHIQAGESEATVTASTIDAAGNPSQTTGTFHIDTEVRDFAMSGTPGGADAVINAAEQGDGFTMTGQVEPGSSVVATFRGAQVNADVAADGSWSATFAGGQIPAGTYVADVVAVATDAANNTSELRQSVSVDTEAGQLTLNAASIGGDGVINGAEADAGVLVTGTADPGATVIVTLDGVEHAAQANTNGQWQSLYSSQEITRGTHDPQVTARTQDAAGNPTFVEASVHVDTQVENLNLSDLNIAITEDGRNVINNDVATQGFSVTGTIEPGSQVFVTIDGVRHAAAVDGNGNWLANFGANEIGSGQRFADLRVDVTDPAGNEAVLTDTVQIDTFVDELSLQGPITADNVVNIAEAQGGLQLSGRVEPGSSATIDVFGRSYDAAVDSAGNWTLLVPQADIPQEDGSTDMVINATDWAGNTDTITETLTYDMVAPDTPGIVGYFREGGGYRNATVETNEDEISIHQVDAGGNVQELALGEQANAFTGETDYFFLDDAGGIQPVSDGSQLVVSATDPGGNTASTYVVLDETSTSVVNIANPNLAAFDIETIDLRFGDQAQLTLSEEQVLALSGNSDRVLIQGGVDDHLTISGAQSAGTTQIDGQTYDVYTLGTDATLVVDDDIQVVT